MLDSAKTLRGEGAVFHPEGVALTAELRARASSSFFSTGALAPDSFFFGGRGGTGIVTPQLEVEGRICQLSIREGLHGLSDLLSKSCKWTSILLP